MLQSTQSAIQRSVDAVSTLKTDPQPFTPPNFVTVVAGYPRSGTSMMMRILEAGGLEVLKDDEFKPPSEHNPKGFYETERTLKLGAEGETTEWLATAVGKAIKVIAYQLRHLPPEHTYKVIFMRRKVKEILASSGKMGLLREDIELSEREQMLSYKMEFVLYEVWLMRQPNMEAIHLWYNDILACPEEQLGKVHQFLGLPLDLEKMVAAVDPNLHRQRAARTEALK
jgi:hypothetical protein